MAGIKDQDKVQNLRRVVATEGEDRARRLAGRADRAELREAKRQVEKSRSRNVSRWKRENAEAVEREQQEQREREQQIEQEREAEDRAEQLRAEHQEEQQRQQELAQEREQQVRSEQDERLEAPRPASQAQREEREKSGVDQAGFDRELSATERMYQAAERAEERDRVQEREGLSL